MKRGVKGRVETGLKSFEEGFKKVMKISGLRPETSQNLVEAKEAFEKEGSAGKGRKEDMEHKKVSKKVKGNSNERRKEQEVRRKEQEERSGEVKLELSNLVISDSEPVTEEGAEDTKSLHKLGSIIKAEKSARGNDAKLV